MGILFSRNFSISVLMMALLGLVALGTVTSAEAKGKAKTAKTQAKTSSRAAKKSIAQSKARSTQSVQSAQRTPAQTGNGFKEVDKPIQVNGQTRNLSMMLTLKGDKDKINFGEVRENYRKEILQTHY